MKARYLIPVLVVTTLASVGSAEAQTVVIADDAIAPPVWAPAVPAVVPPPVVTPGVPVVMPGVVVVRRRPVVAAAPVVVAPRPAPLIATETVVIGPGSCPYGYGYC